MASGLDYAVGGKPPAWHPWTFCNSDYQPYIYFEMCLYRNIIDKMKNPVSIYIMATLPMVSCCSVIAIEWPFDLIVIKFKHLYI